MKQDFKVQCNVCKQIYTNWTGSTPCCGSIAFMLDEQDNPTSTISLFSSINNEPIKETKIDLKK